MFGRSIGIAASGFKGTLPAPPPSATKATFDPLRKGASFTLTNGDRDAEHTSAVDAPCFIQYERSSGKYWIELLLGSGVNVEYNACGLGNASASTSTYLGNDTNSISIFEDATRGTWILYYNDAVVTTVTTGGPQSAPGNVICLYVDVDNRKLFMGIQIAGAGAVQWITDDPVATPTGGIAFTISGNVTPAWGSYYGSTNVTLRDVASFTATSSMPGGAVQGWDNA